MSSAQIASCVVAAVLGFWMLGAYNRLVRLRQAIALSFAQVDAQLQQRHELIPQLTQVAAPFLADQPDALAAVEAARNQARAAADHAAARPNAGRTLASLALAEEVLHGALSRLMAHVKASAPLRAEPGLREVVEGLAAAQNRLSVAKQQFNDAVIEYNRGVRQFPTRLIAGLFGFHVAGKF